MLSKELENENRTPKNPALNVEKIVSCMSRVLQETESKYTHNETECLAVLYAVQQFRPYLYGKPFTLYTSSPQITWSKDRRTVTEEQIK